MKLKKISLGIFYGILQLSGGSLMTFIGLIVTSFCIVFLKGKPHRNGYSYIVEIGGNGGGLELGAVALCGSYRENSPSGYDHTRKHEFGHSLQNIIFGPFTVFIIGIPSAIRYGYQIFAEKRGKKFNSYWYDSIGFEGTATKGGTKVIDGLNKK